MKKRIFALTLCLVLLILPVLSSCSADTLGAFDIQTYLGKDTDSYNTAYNYTMEGDFSSSGATYMVTYEFKAAEATDVELLAAASESNSGGASQVPDGEDDDYAQYNKGIYRVYDIKTGNLLVSKTAILNYTEKDATLVKVEVRSAYENIYSSYINDDYFIIYSTLADGSHNSELYNSDGTLVKLFHTEAEDEWAIDDGTQAYLIRFYAIDHFVIDGSLYRIEDGEATLVRNIENYMDCAVYDDIEFYNNGQYISYDSYNTIVVFDSNLNVTNYISLPTYAHVNGMELSVYFLANNNALVIYSESYGAESLTEDAEYDFVANGTVYNIESYICDINSGELSEIDDIPMYDINVTSLSSLRRMYEKYDLDYAVNDIGDNIITGRKIVDGRVEDVTSTAILNNDGTIGAYVDDLDGVPEYDITYSGYITPDIVVVTLPYGKFLYNAKTYERIGEITCTSYDFDYTSKWIVCEDTIHSLDLEVAYIIPTDYEIEHIGSEVVYLSCYTEAVIPEEEGAEVIPGYTTYYAYDGELREIFRIADNVYSGKISFYDRFFYTMMPNYTTESELESLSSYTCKFYTAEGDSVILELTVDAIYGSVGVSDYADGDFALVKEFGRDAQTGSRTTTYHVITKTDAR